MKRANYLHKDDNIANVLEEVKKGDAVTCISKTSSLTTEALDDVPFGFIISVTGILKGKDILKYGEVIGKAAMGIKSLSVNKRVRGQGLRQSAFSPQSSTVRVHFFSQKALLLALAARSTYLRIGSKLGNLVHVHNVEGKRGRGDLEGGAP